VQLQLKQVRGAVAAVEVAPGNLLVVTAVSAVMEPSVRVALLVRQGPQANLADQAAQDLIPQAQAPEEVQPQGVMQDRPATAAPPERGE